MGDRSFRGLGIDSLTGGFARWLQGGAENRVIRVERIVLLLALVASLWFGADRLLGILDSQRAFPVESGRFSQAGLSRSVEILRDNRGIPHIDADVERDAWQALGFVHAQDRLAQMLWLRRLARGRVAEVVGWSGLDSDRMARTLGIGALADREWLRAPARTRKILEAYSAGLNARIDELRRSAAAPPAALRGSPEGIEDWRPADSIALLKLIAWSSGNSLETSLAVEDLNGFLGSRLSRPLVPTGLGVEGLEGGHAERFERSAASQTSGSRPRPSSARLQLGESTRISGGTAWVLGGEHTASGFPLLVASLNLPTTIPALLYEMQLKSGDLDVVGATIPGIPVVWVGRNQHVAWAAIPSGAVTVDLYRERIRETEQTYHDGIRWLPLQRREESIRIREGSGSSEYAITIHSTHHGPLVEAEPEAAEFSTTRASSEGENSRIEEKGQLALAWTGMITGDGISSLLGLIRAQSADAIRDGLATHHEPVVTVVYADRRGTAGAQMAGWLPRRTLPSSLIPLPGKMRVYDWRKPLRYEAMPAVQLGDFRSTGQGGGVNWLAVADGEIGDSVAEAEIEWLWRPGARLRRLREGLMALTAGTGDSAGAVSKTGGVGLRTAAALQWDVGAGDAVDVVPAILRLAGLAEPLRPEAREVLDMLSGWDGNLLESSSGAAAYEILMQNLLEVLIGRVLEEDLYRRYLALPDARPLAIVASLLVTADRRRSSGGWADLDRVVAGLHESLRRTWVGLSHRLGPDRKGWRWGRLHELEFRPLQEVSVGRGSSAGWSALGVGGDASSIFTTRAAGRGGVPLSTAATYQFAIDLAAPNRILTSLVPGQSEHEGHAHFADGLEAWLAGRPSPLLASRLLVEESSGAALVLEPLDR